MIVIVLMLSFENPSINDHTIEVGRYFKINQIQRVNLLGASEKKKVIILT